MKKIITFLLLLLLMPGLVFASESKNLSETLKDEEIEASLDGYDDNEEKPVIYLFRGKGCSHCYEFLEYVSSDLVKNYGDKFRLVSYEVWDNQENAELMQEVSNYFDDDASGVPYIVIGDKTFNGYSKSMNKEIEEAITKLNESEEKFDIMKKENLISNNKKANKKTNTDKKDNTSIVVTILFSSIALIAVIVTSFKLKKVA